MIDNPEEFKSITDTVKRIAEADNHESLLELINNSDITIRQTGYDNWNGGINYYTVYFEVNIGKFVEVRNDLNQWEQLLLENFSLPIRHLDDEEISRVTIAPKSKLVPSLSRSA